MVPVGRIDCMYLQPLAAMGETGRDDTGAVVDLPSDVSRIVSLVPSLTESIALTEPGLLVGATDWCVQPADLDVVRVRGTKNPDLDRVIGLRPDLVLANEEENRPADLAALRSAGLRVWVTAPRTVPAALQSLDRMLLACRLPRPQWLNAADESWSAVHPPAEATPALVPIWRRPWMALGRDTFAGDVLRRLGLRNVLSDSPDRYPRIDLSALPGYRLVVLPDEPYAFSADDGPEAFPDAPAALISGRHLTWYGPSLIDAPAVLGAQLRPDQWKVCSSAG
jgi:ABC-type Fe3+-hydroxamate transport system substrate-binding protein